MMKLTIRKKVLFCSLIPLLLLGGIILLIASTIVKGAIIDQVESGQLTGVSLEVVISNNPGAKALERAKKHHIPALCVSPKSYATRDEFNQALLDELEKYQLDLIVLAGFLVVIPEIMVKRYPNQIINIHPSLIPSFCGNGYYGLKVHEAALARGVKVTGATVHYVDAGTDTPAQSHGRGRVEAASGCDPVNRRSEESSRVSIQEAYDESTDRGKRRT